MQAQSQETNETNIENLIDSETNKNSKKIRCLRCDSFILQENSGLFKSVEEPILLPSMRSKRDLSNANDTKEKSSASESGDTQIQNDKLKSFWCINDMLTFENIGFTNSVNNIKYLICADCEIGPVGLQYLDNPNEFLVSIDRVKHV
jgi:guanine nucleotide exchange factor